MTVNFEEPLVRFAGDGSTVLFPFRWTSQAANELVVELNRSRLRAGVEYVLQNWDPDTGGDIVFALPPAAGSQVLAYRKTPVTQQVDYVESEPFQAEVHEGQLDKDTRILQEIISAGGALGGPVDLDTIVEFDRITITNTSGDDAVLLAWACSGEKAGLHMGEFSEDIPADGAQTDKPDGYIWYSISEAVTPPPPSPEQPPPSGSNIILTTADVTTTRVVENTTGTFAQLLYAPADTLVAGNIGRTYGFGFTPGQQPWFQTGVFAVPPNAPGLYSVRVEQLSGQPVTGRELDTWLDAFISQPANLNQDLTYRWQVTLPAGGSDALVSATLRFTVAPVIAGSPDASQAVSRDITIRARRRLPTTNPPELGDAVSWESVFGFEFGDQSVTYVASQWVNLPTQGLAIWFDVPAGMPGSVFSIGPPNTSSTGPQGSLNENNLDFTFATPAFNANLNTTTNGRLFGYMGGAAVNPNVNANIQKVLTGGQRYFLNLRNASPGSPNRIELQYNFRVF